MDPPSKVAKTVDVEALVASGALPLGRALTLSRARADAVALMVMESAWSEGTSLAETVFTCLYLHQPALAHLVATVTGGGGEGGGGRGMRALAALGVACLKGVGLAREVVFHADLYEEEDFAPNSYAFDLCPDAKVRNSK